MPKSFLAAVLLSASVEGFGVSRMRDFASNFSFSSKIFLGKGVLKHIT